MQPNRYAFLDGIRGIAAIFVLTRHTDSYWNFIPYRSYLAVDLFFILSGFVIAHAYDEKLKNGTISLRGFVLIRLIRLYPVFFLSLMLCSAMSIWKITSGNAMNSENLAGIYSVILLTGLFLPSHLGGNSNLFPLNGPYWSLFFELIANFAFALLRPLLNNALLLAIIISFGFFLAGVAYFHGNLDLGASWPIQSIAAGFARSMFGVFLGLFLYRHHVFFERHFGNLASPWLAVIVVILILSLPSVTRFDWVIDVLAVAVAFPICVLLASRRTNTRLESLLLTLGSASYPIYVLHKPAGEILTIALKGMETAYAPVSGVVLVLILVALSVRVEKHYDLPLRRRLSSYAFNRGR